MRQTGEGECDEKTPGDHTVELGYTPDSVTIISLVGYIIISLVGPILYWC